ncbi:RNA polymerase sigma-70 factor (ECF subfamily) [Larkinella arboricola]|uniref:RNA polymerase sigma-70 factor (ECF subfamily) n=1 Tax=Larkinella arboricola TaxID=643671 RepID=A0A327X5I9_LARAB|nr:RNA polymerase sigma-70 factor [Larkinella arboricola]RAK01991.1 RNA polymerase sigma-70 factor (ECF subfamily) [Larkinella arboricola]
MSLQSLTDTELLGLLRNDDEQAFRELYDRYWYKMYVTAHRKLRRKDVAEELAQELFVMLWQKRDSLRIINLPAFLGVSLKNLMIDYIRRNIQEEHYLDQLRQFFPAETFSTTEAVQLNELTDAIQNALAQLPEKTREVFILNRFEHLTIREIAQRLNLSEKTIEYHLARSTTFLRQNLRDFVTVWVLFFLS